MEVTAYELALSQLNARRPIAWDGDAQHLYTSDTSNCRYFGVVSTPGVVPVTTAGSGFTLTTTSNSPFPTYASFVQPKLVPVLMYSGPSSGGQYVTAVLQVDGTTVTAASTVPHPSQVGSNNGYLRGLFTLPDQPTIYGYGITGTTIRVWSNTVDAAGALGTWSDLGNVTLVGIPGTFANATASAFPLPISDRLALYPFSTAMYDRLNPTTISSYASILPVTAGAAVGQDAYYANARITPGHVYVQRKDTGSTSAQTMLKVIDVLVSADGATMTQVGEWSAPNVGGTTGLHYADVAVTSSGAAVAICWNWNTGATRIFYDIFGDAPEEVTSEVAFRVVSQGARPIVSNATSEGWLHSSGTGSTRYLTQYEPNLPILTIAGQIDETRVRPYGRKR